MNLLFGSGTLSTAYYFPTQGLYQQALTDAIVQDWQGYIEVFASMLEEWQDETLTFNGIYTLNGISLDGIWEKGKFRVVIHPNGSSNTQIKISNGEGSITAKGQKNKFTSFSVGQLQVLEFDGNQPIILSNKS